MNLTAQIQELITFNLTKLQTDEAMQASVDALIMQGIKEVIMDELRSPESIEKVRGMIKKKLTDKHFSDAVGAAFDRGKTEAG